MKKSFALIFLVLLFFPLKALIFAQETEPVYESVNLYDKGDQIFSIHAGVIFPLFFYNPASGVENRIIPAYEHLNPGGFGFLEWGGFLNPNMTLGLEFGGIFALSNANKRILFMVPVSLKYTYIFFKYPFEIPLSLGLGINVSKLNEQLFFGPSAQLGAGLLVDLQNQWSLGGTLQYLFIPEIYFEEKADKTRFGNFLTLSFSAIYHF